MPRYGTTREDSGIIKVLYYVGFFVLFSSLGTFGSAGFLTYRANVAQTQWPEAAAQIEDCMLGEYGSAAKASGEMSYALHCGVTYQLAGRSYKNSISTKFTHSLQDRSEIKHWIALNRPGSTLNIRVDPSYPDRLIVQSPLPGTRGDNPVDFMAAAVIMLGVSMVVLETARRLYRRGW
jgi:hypothetical protein